MTFVHWENWSSPWTRVVVLGNVQPCSVFKPIQSPVKWSNLFHLTRLSVLNEKKINIIIGIDTVSRVEKLPAEHGLSCWKITKWTRFILSVWRKSPYIIQKIYAFGHGFRMKVAISSINLKMVLKWRCTIKLTKFWTLKNW